MEIRLLIVLHRKWDESNPRTYRSSDRNSVWSQVPCSQFVASVLIKLARELDLISRYTTANKANISITAYSISYLVLTRHFTINKCCF